MFVVIMTIVPHQRARKTVFSFSRYGGRENALRAAQHAREMLSLTYGHTRNRYTIDTDPVTGESWLSVDILWGLTMKVDREMLPHMEAHAWHATRSNTDVYATTKINGKLLQFHHLVLQQAGLWPFIDPSLKCDHISGDTLDNRRANLRVVTHKENQRNHAARANRSGVTGVMPASRGVRAWLAMWPNPDGKGNPVVRRFPYTDATKNEALAQAAAARKEAEELLGIKVRPPKKRYLEMAGITTPEPPKKRPRLITSYFPEKTNDGNEEGGEEAHD